MKVQVARSVLDGFRKRALKKYPSEYMETIFGRISGQVIQILAFYPIEHEGTPGRCAYYAAAMEEQQDGTDCPPKMKWLGTIHSHPEGSSTPSDADWETAREDGEVISGIYQILPSLKRKGRKIGKVKFYSEPVQELEIVK
jgi:proteasome lid subunit RPN8/RPN11